MPEKKKSSSRIQIIFSAMLLGLIIMVQFYCMINLPDQIVVIGLLAVLLLLVLYVLLRNIIAEFSIWKEHREEEYENLIKASKASYLMMKKYFEEIEDTLEYVEKEVKLPTEEIVGTQKGIGKAIINRSRENADAIISSNDQLMERVGEISRMVEENREQVIENYRSMSENSLQQIELKQQDIIVSLKDMELRLNNAIAQSQKLVAAAAPAMTAPVAQQEAKIAPEMEPVIESTVEPEEAGETPEAELLSETPEEGLSDDIEELLAAVPEVEAAVESGGSSGVDAVGENGGEPELGAAAEASAVAESVATSEAGAASEAEPAAESEATTEEKSPMPDLSDPNKKMSADDIAALFAAMT
jgi:hypothetical protein